MKPVTNPTKINHLLTRRVEKIYPSEQALKKVLLSGKRLRLYQGFDPSTPNLHIGHLVGLLKLKEFQEMGHEVIFLIGDFTGMIGDPTGKLKTRKALTHQQILKNAETYKKQVKRILKFSGTNPVKLKFNYSWNSKLSFLDALKLTAHLTVPQLLERDMFQERLKKGQNISLLEFLYPLVQGYDSIAMDVDLEIGGSDQMFNMMIGRDLMHKIKKKEKFVMTTKLLIDSSGKKIGKTEGNVINIANPPSEFFGQIMSLSDEAILPCFELITELPLSSPRHSELVSESNLLTISSIKKALDSGENPMKYKKLLAFVLTEMLNGEGEAQKAQREFERVHQSRELPTKIPTFPLKELTNNPINVLDLLVESRLAKSKSEAKRLVSQKAVKLNNITIKQPASAKATAGKYNNITIKKGDIIKVGKRKFLKII